MPKQFVRGAILTLAAILVVGLVPGVVLARESEDESGDDATTTTTTQEDNPTKLEDAKERVAELRAKNQARLSETKQKVCETRKKNITAIMARSAVRAENQLKLFSNITDRVKAFYVKKGKTLDTYDRLVADVELAKAKAQTDIATLKSMDGFSCTSDDPKGDADAFKAALKLVREDLKAYRTAVKNLIVGVKSVQSTTKPTDATDTGGSQ